jgi:hypothetical protein
MRANKLVRIFSAMLALFMCLGAAFWRSSFRPKLGAAQGAASVNPAPGPGGINSPPSQSAETDLAPAAAAPKRKLRDYVPASAVQPAPTQVAVPIHAVNEPPDPAKVRLAMDNPNGINGSRPARPIPGLESLSPSNQ